MADTSTRRHGPGGPGVLQIHEVQRTLEELGDRVEQRGERLAMMLAEVKTMLERQNEEVQRLGASTEGLIKSGTPSVKESTSTPKTVSDLRAYFQTEYAQGGEFQHADYEVDADWTWIHKPTKIRVWRDAIDLRERSGDGEAYFHYTSEMAFCNITNESKAVAEVWASLNTDGPKANAWWGQGVYTVPSPPDQWRDREALLENNFRNMMKRDEEAYGADYVRREYPPRVAFCVPLIIDPWKAYDVSKRATPEMVKAGKPPGTNLADKRLDGRCCVVLRVSGEDGITHACSSLLKVLRTRAALAVGALKAEAQLRLGEVLHGRGLLEEAEVVLRAAQLEVPGDGETAHTARVRLAVLLADLHRHEEAVQLLGQEDLHALASALAEAGRCQEAYDLDRACFEENRRVRGADDKETLKSMMNLGASLQKLERMEEAVGLLEECLEMQKKVRGEQHPDTLSTMSHLAFSYQKMNKLQDAAGLWKACLKGQEKALGGEHVKTQDTRQRLAQVQALISDEIDLKALDAHQEPVDVQALSVKRGLFSGLNTLKSHFQDVGLW